jgi:hypothetical protein
MPNSSSSKYVKRRAHRRTKSRRHAKKYTIKKVMRGCNSKQYGGAQVPLASSAVGGNGNTVGVGVPPGTNPGSVDAITKASAAVLKAQTFAGDTGTPEEFTPGVQPNIATQKGGYKSKHRRRRYKKSIGRKGRSRRFRGSRK